MARINWEFLDVIEKIKDPKILVDYDLREDPLDILIRIKTPRILIPQEIDSQGNVVYGGNVPITQSKELVPRFFDSDFFGNDFRHSFDEEPKREDYRDPTVLKQNSQLIKAGKEGLRKVISRRKGNGDEEETLRGTRYSQSTRNLRREGFYEGSINEYLISLEERRRQIRALSELGKEYLKEMR